MRTKQSSTNKKINTSNRKSKKGIKKEEKQKKKAAGASNGEEATNTMPGQPTIVSFFTRAPNTQRGKQVDEDPPKVGSETEAKQPVVSAETKKRKKGVISLAAPPKSNSQDPKKESKGSREKPAKTKKEEPKAPVAEVKKGKKEEEEKEEEEVVAVVVDAEAEKQEEESVTGKRIRVWWPAEREWFTGTVASANKSGAKVCVDYDDGDQEWISLGKRRHEFLSGGKEDEEVDAALTTELEQKSARRKSKRRRMALLDSEDDEDSEIESEIESESEEAGKGGKSKRKSKKNDSDSDYCGEASDDDSESEEDMEEDMDEDEVVELEVSSPKKRGRASAPKKTPPSSSSGVSLKKSAGQIGLGGVGSKGKGSLGSFALGSASTKKPAPSPAPAPDAAMKKELPQRVIINKANSCNPEELKEKLESSQELGKQSARDSFSTREKERFKFLSPDKIADANGRKRTDPLYDPSTLYIPPRWFKDFKVSPGQRQWWTFKSQNFDSVLLFKMGKFYEMYEMDAHIGVEHLGLIYMKGEQPHCGFPEKAYSLNAERLARKGFKVVVVEQTETPEQLAERNAERRKKGQKNCTVVNREMVAVLSPGTLFDAEMVRNSHQNSYVVAIAEAAGAAAGGGGVGGATEEGLAQAGEEFAIKLGVAAVDVTTGRMLIGQLSDNATRSKLNTFLTAIKPAEIIIPKDCGDCNSEMGVTMGKETREILKTLSRTTVKFTELIPEEQFWTGDKGLEVMASYYEGGAIPKVLQEMRGKGNETIALHALGGMISFLQRSLLDQAVIPICQFEILPKDGVPCLADDEVGARLDASALANLEIVENSEGDVEGTLLSQLDHCASGPGHRLLRQWLLHPLKNIRSIVGRQQAVKELMDSRLAEDFHSGLRRIPDLERSLTRMAASARGTGREACNVVLYEDASRKRLRAFLSTLRGFKTLSTLANQLASDIPSPKSPLLKSLLTLGDTLPELQSLLEEFENAFDWTKAEKEGRVIPNDGVDAAYDEAATNVSGIESELEDYLNEQRDLFGSKNQINYFSHMGTKYQIEVPEKFRSKIPAYYELTSQRKGNSKQPAVSRYQTKEIRDMLGRLTVAEESLERALSQILKSLISRFCNHITIWQKALEASAKLDCLFAFSLHAGSSHEMCQPSFEESETPLFVAEALAHPAGGFLEDSNFVTNDISLGGKSSAPFVLLTGPNMGGKSTLIRQVCLATILAQVGAHVPAKSLSLTPADAVFVRMGARDSILTGQSTFHVELSETSSILDLATPKSLVALDEFGRGTATTDGIALAAAVMQHLIKKVGCLTLFATHYHGIALDNEDNKDVMTCHMACQVNCNTKPTGESGHTEEDSKAVPDVTFLYKLRHGICPNSYGVSVAKLAGIPQRVLDRAVQIQLKE